jgi:Protein of unknown function (DUF2934)
MSDEKAKPSSGEEIELRAHQIYVERGRVDGHHMSDWRAAEVQLTGQSQSAVPESPTSGPLRAAALKSQRSRQA